jgi:hypothetical protein
LTNRSFSHRTAEHVAFFRFSPSPWRSA